MEEDRTLFAHHPSVWWLPSVAIVKSRSKKRWTAFFSIITSYVDEWPGHYFTWFLQFRLWWPPIMFYRGWIDKTR